MKIDGENIDQRAIAIWKADLNTAEESLILDFVERNPELSAGFRPGKIAIKVAITKIQSLLDKPGEMRVSLRSLLSNIGLDRSLLAVLSEEAIFAAQRPLCIFFDSDPIFSAMLVSDRENVRYAGIVGFKQGSVTNATNEEKEIAGTEINKLFNPLLNILSRHSSPFSSKNREKNIKNRNSTNENSDIKIKSELNEKTKEIKRLTKDLSEKKVALENSNKKLTLLEIEINKLQVTLKNEQIAFTTLSQNFELAVAEETQHRVDSKVLPWLQPAEELANLAEQMAKDNILEKATTLLNKQEKIDRRFGVWSQLTRERDQCLDMIQRLASAKKESLRPLPELNVTTKLLADRIDELNTFLGKEIPISNIRSLVQDLSNQINNAKTLEELAVFRLDLEASHRLGFMQEKALSEAYRLVDQACWKIYSVRPEKKQGEIDYPLTQIPPLHTLQILINQEKPFLLLIDGHNAVFRLRDILQLEFEENLPGSKARNQLTDKAAAFAARFPFLEIHLWYDSEDAQDVSVINNFTVHFSGGVGSNRADREILKYLESIKYRRGEQKNQLKAIVTADKDLSEEARSQNDALSVVPEELAILFSLA